jgi:hypothetical protein
LWQWQFRYLHYARALMMGIQMYHNFMLLFCILL